MILNLSDLQCLREHLMVLPQHSPDRFICRGSGGFGKRAGYRDRPPRGQVTTQICCEYQYKIDISSKTQCFLMVFGEKRDFS